MTSRFWASVGTLAFAVSCAEAKSVARAPSSATVNWPALNEEFLAAAAATLNFRLGQPVTLAILADGAVLFRRTPARAFASDLYQLDSTTGQVTTLVTVEQLLGGTSEKLSDAEKARRERTRTATRGVVAVSPSKDGKRILVPLGERLFLVERGATITTREITVGEGFPYDPQLSPDGSKVAFIRDGDLWVSTLLATAGVTSAPTRLTQHPADFEYAVADFAAQEELGRTRGYWWAPDSRSLVFQRTDARAVDTLYVADSRNNDSAPVPFKYPRAGRNNAIVDLGIIAVDATPTMQPTWLTWDIASFPYLVDVDWRNNAPLSFTVLNRTQTEMRMLIASHRTSQHTGAGAVSLSVVHTEKDPAWINVADGAPYWFEDGSGYLWMSEASGAWQLERYDAAGKRVAVLTDAKLGLRSLVGVDADAGVAFVVAAADARQSHVYKIALSGVTPAPPIALSDVAAGGVSSAYAKHGVVVMGTAARTGGFAVTVVAANGKITVLPSVAELPALVPTTVLEQMPDPKDATRIFNTAITRPRDFDPGKKYPVLLKVYGGPGAHKVTAARDAYLMDQWYADAGFIVVRADGRGTPNRGRSWERAILQDLITVPMHDQIAALQAMGAAHPEMDMARVGVFGWSFGGYVATMAVLLYPDVFHAAVAGAPVTDWQLYDTVYTERYLKTPTSNAAGYTHTSALTHAAKLARPLLLIHGITDDNVHLAHTLALLEALYVGGKRAEVVMLAGTHMVSDPKLNLARENIQIDFFRQHLAPR